MDYFLRVNNIVSSLATTNFPAGTTSFLSSTISKIGFAQLAQIALLYKLYDSAIANILCLETQRHGTSLIGYLKISAQGGKISEGGSLANDRYRERCLNKIYVYRDYLTTNNGNNQPDSLYRSYILRGLLGPLMGSLTANWAYISNRDCAIFPAAILAIITPTIKYRFTEKQQVQDFRVDEIIEDHALYTQKDIGISHLGITGSIIQGVNKDLCNRISKNPPKFIFGCVQLVSAVALTAVFAGVVTSSPMINTAIVAVSEGIQNYKIISSIALGVLYLTAI